MPFGAIAQQPTPKEIQTFLHHGGAIFVFLDDVYIVAAPEHVRVLTGPCSGHMPNSSATTAKTYLERCRVTWRLVAAAPRAEYDCMTVSGPPFDSETIVQQRGASVDLTILVRMPARGQAGEAHTRHLDPECSTRLVASSYCLYVTCN